MKKPLLFLSVAGLSLLFAVSVFAAPSTEQLCASYIDSLDAQWDTITAGALYKDLANYVVVDVRTPQEYVVGHIEGAINVSLRELVDNLDKIPQDKTIVVHCKSGIRSSYAHAVLSLMGYDNVLNLSGGFNAWLASKLPVQK